MPVSCLAGANPVACSVARAGTVSAWHFSRAIGEPVGPDVAKFPNRVISDHTSAQDVETSAQGRIHRDRLSPLTPIPALSRSPALPLSLSPSLPIEMLS